MHNIYSIYNLYLDIEERKLSHPKTRPGVISFPSLTPSNHWFGFCPYFVPFVEFCMNRFGVCLLSFTKHFGDSLAVCINILSFIFSQYYFIV